MWYLLIASPLVGSFLGVIVERLPRNEPVVLGRSCCSHCRTTLSLPDLIPIVSWLALRGRCRHCAAPVGVFYPLIELAAVAVALWAAAVTSGWVLFASCLLGWMLLTLAVIDWRHFWLPDVLTLPLTAAGLAAAYVLDSENLVSHLLGAAIGFGAAELIGWTYRQLRHREGLGHGDAKLLAAAGAWVGWEGLPTVVLIGAVAGLFVALTKSLFSVPAAASPNPLSRLEF